jgi:type IV pilus assembly protein PilC
MALLEQTVADSQMQTSDDRPEAQPVRRGPTAYADGGAEQTLVQKITNFSVEFGPGKKDILNFTNQISVMIKAGISLPDALESIGEQMEKKKFKVIILDLKERIESGQSFSQALGEHMDVFGSLYVNMVAAAEISGSMSSMLLRLAEYLDQEAQTRSQVLAAMIYPIIIAIMAIGTTFFLLMFVLPKFLTVFAGKEHLLPAPTKIIMLLSNFLRGYWFIVLPGMAGTCCAFWYFINTKVGRVWWDKAKLKIPLLKTLCRCLYITRSLHTMGVLTAAGVPILDTIAITAQISGNVLYEKMWRSVHDAVRQGKKITESLEGFTLMPNSVVRMIRAGEDSGTLSDVLKDVAEFYSRELKTVIKMVTSMIEPIMIVVMGALVGFIASSIILPIFKMSKVVTS